MNILSCNYLEFIPGKTLGKRDDVEIEEDAIYIFSRRNNNKIYKRKRAHIGSVIYHKEAKHWVFVPCEETSYCCETLLYINGFLDRLEQKKIIFNIEKGELKL